MRPFLDWLSSPGFNITRGWNTVDGWIGPGKAEPFDTQRRILGHCFTLGENGKFPYTTIVYCAAIGTRVLRADFRWVPVESLKVGDGLLAFDEDAQAVRVMPESFVHQK